MFLLLHWEKQILFKKKKKKNVLGRKFTCKQYSYVYIIFQLAVVIDNVT